MKRGGAESPYLKSIAIFLLVVCLASCEDVLHKKTMLGRSIRRIEYSLFEKNNEQVASELAGLIKRANEVHSNLEDYEEVAENLQRLEGVLGVTYRKRQVGFVPDYSIFDNFPVTKTFVSGSDARFVFELLGDGRDVFVGKMTTLAFTLDLPAGVIRSDVDTFLRGLMGILVNQTITNPPQYVSHGTDHSVRVMNWAFSLLQIEDLSNGMLKYGLSSVRTQFALSILGIIHDIGYNDVDAHSVSKWLHAVAGSIMAENLINSGKNKAVLCNNNNIFCLDFINAIKYHNFDESYCIWTTNTKFASTCTFTTSGDPNNPSAPSTPMLPPNNTYTREYVKGSTSDSPLHFVVRVADNLDAIRTRLTPVQNDAQMMRYFYRLYVDYDLRQQNGIDTKSEKYTTTLAAARQRAIDYSGLTNATADQKAVMSKADAQSFLHFYSNWIIKDSFIDSENWLVNVTFWEAQPPLDFSSHIGAALFQINRFASSAVSLSVNGGGANFADVIRVSFNTNSGLDSGGYLPLKAFTQKPVYTQNGIAKDSKDRIIKLCGPYCNDLTISLTQSFEKCMDANNNVVACDNSKFALLQPYDSLNYEVTAPTPVVDTSAPKEEETVNKDAIIVGVIFGVVILVLAGVVAAVVILGKKGKLSA